MRKVIFILLVFFVFSCEEDIEHPVAKETWPVVHCLLDADDSVQYLRLGKTFSGTDFEGMISNSDSLYFRDASVYFDFSELGGKQAIVRLEPSDEMERQPGVFPVKPFRLYKTNYPIEPGAINLRIEIPEINRFVKATIGVRSKPVFKYPNPRFKKMLDFYEEEHVRIQWDGYENVCETTVRLWYLETREDGSDTCKLDWTRYSFDFVLFASDWIDYMLYWIKDDYHVRARRVLSVDILATGGNYQLDRYLTYKDWTIDLIDKPYSNLINAYGIVASRASGGLFDYLPDQQFVDTLAFSQRTQRLKFVNWLEPGH